MAHKLERKLRDRLKGFVSPSVGDKGPVGAMRAGIVEVLARIAEREWQAYIVGGTLRDVMLAPAFSFPRDIDLILVGPTQVAMEETFRDLCVRKTRFGGLHLVRPFEYRRLARIQGDVLFDVWRLEDTWGLRVQGLPRTIDSFVKTPFLNIDSVAIDVSATTGSPRVAESGFFESLSTRTLDINYEPNPFPLVCIVRTLLMAAKLEFALTRRLASFVCGYSRWGTFDDLFQSQLSHYGQARCTADEMRSWINQISADVAAGSDRVLIRLGHRRQTELWETWPPISREREVLPSGHQTGPPLAGSKSPGIRKTLGHSQENLTLFVRS